MIERVSYADAHVPRRRVVRVDDCPKAFRGDAYWAANLERYARLVLRFVHAAVFATDDETRRDATTFALGAAELTFDTARAQQLEWHPGAQLAADLIRFLFAPRSARRRSPGAHQVPAAIPMIP